MAAQFMDTESPIFILGTERSGSNLLRLILNSHSNITVPHPPHIVHYFKHLEPYYGDPREDKNFQRLIDDILGLLDVHIYPWDISPERNTILREARPRDAFGVMIALYEQYRRHTGKARWGCKSTFMIHHVPAILKRFPQARLILLVRDPRDVAASSRQSVFSPYHPLLTARLWASQQHIGMKWHQKLPSSSLHVLFYEDLTTMPERALERLCGFLDEPFEKDMLNFFHTREARKSGRLSESWKATASPVSTKSLRRFEEELTRDELLNVESSCLEAMRYFGYSPRIDPEELKHHRPSLGDGIRARLLDDYWRLKVEMRSWRRDRNAGRRWARALYLRKVALVLKHGPRRL